MAKSFIPTGAIRVALRRASGQARQIPNVLSVGRGFKHRGGGYCEGDSACVKFLVSEKVQEPERRIPPHIHVRYRGQAYAIPTDVVSMQHTLEQSLPCWRDTQPDTRGTLCSLHSDEAGRLFALTAGHVLKSAPGIGIVGGPWGGAGVGISGAIAPNATDFVDNGRYFDVGVIGVNSLDPGVASLPPWNQLRQLITSAGLSKVIYKTNGQPSSGRVYGADGTVAVMFDGIYRDDFLWNSRLYAAPLIGYRDNTGTLRGGFSGSAVTDASGTQLLGLHILGEEGPNALGFAQSVSLLQYQVASRMNCTLSLAGR